MEAHDKYSNPKMWAKRPNGITLVCTSLNPNIMLLNKMLESAKGFDEIILHIDPKSRQGVTLPYVTSGSPIRQYFSADSLEVGDAYNRIISQSETEWICCFCDDDYFYYDGLREMIKEVHRGIDADVAHYKFKISGYLPPEDRRGRVIKLFTGKSDYVLCEKQSIVPKLIGKHNRMPAGSFFRKSAWEKVGGFKGSKCHDHDLWHRISKAGCTFKYFDYLVYNFVRRHDSAWIRQHETKV